MIPVGATIDPQVDEKPGFWSSVAQKPRLPTTPKVWRLRVIVPCVWDEVVVYGGKICLRNYF